MSEKKYVVPREMYPAFMRGYNICWGEYKGNDNRHLNCMDAGLNAALRWIAENPRVPTVEEIVSEAKGTRECDAAMYVQWIGWWQRRMFLAPESVVPEEVKDLWEDAPMGGSAQKAIIEAFRRGQQSK